MQLPGDAFDGVAARGGDERLSLKNAPANELADAIQRIMDGKRVIAPDLAVAALIAGESVHGARRGNRSPHSPSPVSGNRTSRT